MHPYFFLLQVYSHEYDLIVRPDVNTHTHTQWFFFSVANTRKDVKYKFNIINLLKNDSMYSYGMQPVIHSEKLLSQKARYSRQRAFAKLALAFFWPYCAVLTVT